MNKHTHITLAAPTTTTVFSGAGTLLKVIINKPLANGVITIYDNTAASGTVVGISTKPGTLLNDATDIIDYGDGVSMALGCTIVTSGAAQDITVIWKQ